MSSRSAIGRTEDQHVSNNFEFVAGYHG